MKKGIHPIIPFAIILGMVLVLEYFYISYFIRSEFVVSRFLREAPFIAEADKVETYVRSYQNAVELSLIQSIHDTGNGTVILESDFDSIYSEQYKIPYWRIHGNKYVPKDEKVALTISKISLAYMIDYFNEYKEFSKNSFEMEFPEEPRSASSYVKDAYVTVSGNLLIFKRDEVIDIEREFYPEAKVRTKFGKIRDIAETFVEDDRLGNCINDNETKADAQDCLDNLISGNVPDDEEDYIEVKLTLMIFNNPDGLHNGIIKVDIYENDKNYPVYIYQDDSVQLKGLGVSFLIKVGGLIEYDPDQVVAEEVPNFHDCGSGLGVISKRSKDEICPFLQIPEIEYEGCEDSDDGIEPEEPGTTISLIDSERDAKNDTCNFVTNTLTEYYCLAPPGARRASMSFKCNSYCQRYGDDYSGVCAENPQGEGYCLCSKCELNSVEIEPNGPWQKDCFDGYSPYCEQGERIKVETRYSDKCPPQAYIQIDSWQHDTPEDRCLVCDYDTEVNPDCLPPYRCDVLGINVVCSGSPCTEYWTIPSYPLTCWDKVIEAGISTLKDDYECNGGMVHGWLGDTEGSFTFASCIDSDRDPAKDIGNVYGDTPGVGGTTNDTTGGLKDTCTPDAPSPCNCFCVDSCSDIGMVECTGCDSDLCLNGPCPVKKCCTLPEDMLTEYYCEDQTRKSKSYDCDQYCKGIDPDSIGKCFEDTEGQGYCYCVYKLTVETVLDVAGNPPVRNVQVTVGGDAKSDPSGIVEYSLPIGDHTIEAEREVDDPKGLRPFSHFWDHDCDPVDLGYFNDTDQNPYPFTMYDRERKITAFYKTFTNITDFDYDGATISGKLLNEFDNPIGEDWHRHFSCDGYRTGKIDRDVTLEYYDGSWHGIGSATSSTDDGSWSLDWSCVPGTRKLRATYMPSNWYYNYTSATIDIICPCTLDSVNLVPDCSGGSSEYCETGEIIKVQASFSGDCYIPAYIQVDTVDPAGTCSVCDQDRSNCADDLCEMTGINAVCYSSPCEEEWTIPAIASECYGKTESAFAASLRDDYPCEDNCADSIRCDYLSTPTGSFTFCKDNSNVCTRNTECCSGNCESDYDGDGNLCCDFLQCAHDEVCYDEGSTSGSWACCPSWWGGWIECDSASVCAVRACSDLIYCDPDETWKSGTGSEVDAGTCVMCDGASGIKNYPDGTQDSTLPGLCNGTWEYCDDGVCKIKYKLRVNTIQDITDFTMIPPDNPPVTNVEVTVDGDTKYSNASGIVEFMLTPEDHDITVEDPTGSRPFSHYWDHDCDGTGEHYLDTDDNPYTFTMFEKDRTITAFYKTFTHIVGKPTSCMCFMTDSCSDIGMFDCIGCNLAGPCIADTSLNKMCCGPGKLNDFDYNGTTISGKLLDEKGGGFWDTYHRHLTCNGYTNGPIERDVKLEYYDGSWHEVPGSPVTAKARDPLDVGAPGEGSWSLGWVCTPSTTRLRASFNPSQWYYVGTSATKDIICNRGFLDVQAFVDSTEVNAIVALGLGDVNWDGKVNDTDLWYYHAANPNSCFYSRPGDPNWNVDCDMNCDDKIDVADTNRVGRYYGQDITIRTTHFIEILDAGRYRLRAKYNDQMRCNENVIINAGETTAEDFTFTS